jgi:hypothetical protein
MAVSQNPVAFQIKPGSASLPSPVRGPERGLAQPGQGPTPLPIFLTRPTPRGKV